MMKKVDGLVVIRNFSISTSKPSLFVFLSGNLENRAILPLKISYSFFLSFIYLGSWTHSSTRQGSPKTVPFFFGTRTNQTSMDFQTFVKDDFNVNHFLKSNLASRTSEGIRDFRSELLSMKESTASDLQKQVHKNYSEFVNISKEISNLEGDMLSLRELLHDLTAVNDGLRQDEVIIQGHYQIYKSFRHLYFSFRGRPRRNTSAIINR
jgi:hypothetical protein